MKKETMQVWINHANTPEMMRRIGEAYLDGIILKDLTAAEAWLLKAVEANDPIESPKAMALIARRVLGISEVIPETDLTDIRTRLPDAQNAEREEMEILLKIGEK